MKKIFLLLILSISIFHPAHLQAQGPLKPPANEARIKWYTFEDAIRLNKKNPKKMVVDMYTEWCGWCKRMDAETFTNPTIVKYMNSHFYCVKFDAERKDTLVVDGVKYVNPNPKSNRSTHQYAELLLRHQLSYPSYVFLNEHQQSVTVVPGYHQAKEFEVILSWFGEDAYLTKKFDEY
ncbi:MAG: DUF255 domain-containing protein, partial [Bacteroidota bacterium]